MPHEAKFPTSLLLKLTTALSEAIIMLSTVAVAGNGLQNAGNVPNDGGEWWHDGDDGVLYFVITIVPLPIVY